MKATSQEQAIFVILALAGVGIVLVATSVYGPGLSPDSVAYIFAAKSLTSGNGYSMISGHAFVHWPPLFPTLLAGMASIGIDPLNGARLFNAAIFGLIIFVTGHLLRTHLKSMTLVLVGTAFLLVSVIFLRVSIMAWSEPLFVLLTIAFFFYLSKFLKEQRFKFLILIGILAGVACLQRYIGFTLIFTGIISIFFFTHSGARHQTLKSASFFGFVSSIPLAIWLGRNYALTSTISGVRPPSTTGFFQNAAETLKSVSFWLLPTDYATTTLVQVLLAILGVGLLAVLIGLAVRVSLFRCPRLRTAPLAPIAIFVPMYILALIIVRIRFDFYAPIGDRLLSPIYAFVLLFTLLGIESVVRALSPTQQGKSSFQRLWPIIGASLLVSGLFLNEWTVSRLLFIGDVKNQWILDNLLYGDRSIRPTFRVIMLIFSIATVFLGLVVIGLRSRPWIGRLVMVGLFSVWVIYPITQSFIYVYTKTESGAGGFNTDGWRNSSLIERLQTEPLDGTLYTNVPDAIFILTDPPSTHIPIRFPYQDLHGSSSAIPEFIARLASEENDTYLVWVDNESLLDPARDPHENLANVSLMFDLEQVARFPDGAIYSFR